MQISKSLQRSKGDTTKRVFIIHGWGGTAQSNWIPWLKNELTKKSIEVHALEMPNTQDPDMAQWVSYLSSQAQNPDTDTYFLGHSMGCQTILRYLERLDLDEKVGGVVLVAGFLTIREEAMIGDAQKVLTPWVKSNIDLQKVKNHSEKFVSIASDNDPYISLENSKSFEDGLGAKIIVIPNAGHFTIENGGYKELHVALNELLKMIK